MIIMGFMISDLAGDYSFAKIGEVLAGGSHPERPGFDVSVFVRIFPIKMVLLLAALIYVRSYLFYGFVAAYVLLYVYGVTASS
jgi:hypothetical protein